MLAVPSTQGDTLDDAAFNAAEVLTAILSYRLDHGQTIPAPSAPAGRAVATPDAKTQAVMLLRDAVAGYVWRPLHGRFGAWYGHLVGGSPTA